MDFFRWSNEYGEVRVGRKLPNRAKLGDMVAMVDVAGLETFVREQDLERADQADLYKALTKIHHPERTDPG